MEMEIVIGILLVCSFIVLVIYAARGGNMTMGMLLMATTWTALAIIGNLTVTNQAFIADNEAVMSMTWLEMLTKTYQKGPEGWGPLLVNVMFGAWFGQVVLQTGIASTIIKRTVELGGDKPKLTMVLLSIVSTIIFISIYSPGAVIGIAQIVIPILLSIGIPKIIAVISFIGAVGASAYMNPVQFNLLASYTAEINDGSYVYDSYIGFGTMATAIQLSLVIIAVLILMRSVKSKPVRTWAVATKPEVKYTSFTSMLTPLIPVALLITFKIPIILGFLIGGTCGYLTTGNLKQKFKNVASMYSKDLHDGAVSAAPIVGFVLAVPMLISAAGMCGPYFKALLGGLLPESPLLIVALFTVLAPFAFFRGPLSVFGCGIAIMTIVINAGFPIKFVLPLFMIPAISVTMTTCVTQSWTAWILGYTQLQPGEFLKRTFILGWISCAILFFVLYFWLY